MDSGIPHIAAEAAPLLPERRASISAYSAHGEDGNVIGLEAALKAPDDDDTTWRQETKLVAKYSLPLMLTYFLQYSFNLVAILIVGHLGTKELGAMSIANMTATITGGAIYEGLTTSLDTLCAQAYGSGRKDNVGLHVQRMIVLLLLVSIPILTLWFCGHWFLPYLIPEREVALLAAEGLRILMIGAPGFAVFEAGKRFLQAQGNFHTSFHILLITAPFNALLSYLLVYQADLGFHGALLSLSISQLLLPILLVLYIVFLSSPSTLDCWPGLLPPTTFINWMPMLRLSLPGVLMVESEGLAFEILTFAASYINPTALAAQSVLLTIGIVIYHLPYPVSIAASTRIGNLIGAGALHATKVALRAYILIFIFIGVLDTIILVSLRNLLPLAFTSDPEVISLVAAVLPIVTVMHILDSMAALGNGALRGFGRQVVGGWANLSVYYVIALPLALALAFGEKTQWGLWGLWTGPAIGLGLIAAFDGLYLRSCNWEKCVSEAKAREE